MTQPGLSHAPEGNDHLEAAIHAGLGLPESPAAKVRKSKLQRSRWRCVRVVLLYKDFTSRVK